MAASSLRLIFKAAATQGSCCPGAQGGGRNPEPSLGARAVPSLAVSAGGGGCFGEQQALLCARLGAMAPGPGCALLGAPCEPRVQSPGGCAAPSTLHLPHLLSDRPAGADLDGAAAAAHGGRDPLREEAQTVPEEPERRER